MKRAKLDKIDKKILRDLQDNGRMTNVDLAKNVGISAPPCLRRVRALEESGFIDSYHAHLNPVALGYTVTVFASVSVDNHAEQKLKDFENYIKEFEKVRECHILTGDVDFLLKIVAKDWDDYQNFLSKHLTTAPGVSAVRSSLAVRALKVVPGVPVES